MDGLARTAETDGTSPPKRLEFYHGTRWSIAQRIPKNVKPLGRGDFAAGFYTHHDGDDTAGLIAARASVLRVAARSPAEPYAGGVVFGVWDDDYLRICGDGKSKVFDLTRTDDPALRHMGKEMD